MQWGYAFVFVPIPLFFFVYLYLFDAAILPSVGLTFLTAFVVVLLVRTFYRSRKSTRGSHMNDERITVTFLLGIAGVLLCSCQPRGNDGSAFHTACANGDTAEMKSILEKGFEIDQIREGQTGLMVASGRGNIEVVRLVIREGADVNRQGSQQQTALILASAFGHVEVARVLLQNGADFRSTDTGLTPLMMASAEGHDELVKLLIATGDDVNAVQPDGWTPLMHAAARNQPSTVGILIQSGSDMDAENEDQKTSSDIAAENGFVVIEEVLERQRKQVTH